MKQSIIIILLFFVFANFYGQTAFENLLSDKSNKLEEKLKNTVDETFKHVESKIDSTIYEVKGELDKNIAEVRKEVNDVKTEILASAGKVTVRITVVDIIVSLIGTLITAILTSFMVVRKLATDRFNKEMERIAAEGKQHVKEMGDIMAIKDTLNKKFDELMKENQKLRDIVDKNKTD